MDEIEYLFGTGDGAAHVWADEADLALANPATPDAVRLDFDGDGLVDDAMWDTGNTGRADIAALDLDDDGVLDHFYTDPTGLGTWNHLVTGTAADAVSEPLDWIVRTDDWHTGAPAPADTGVAQEYSSCEVEPAPSTVDPDVHSEPKSQHPMKQHPMTQHPMSPHPATPPPMSQQHPEIFRPDGIHPEIPRPGTAPDNLPHTELPDYLAQWINRTGGGPDQAPIIS